MPSMTFEQALAQLAGVNNKEQLDNLISRIDNSFTGNEAVLFSGYHVDDEWYGSIADDLTRAQPGVQSVRSTEAGRFLDFSNNRALLQKLAELFGDDPRAEGTDAFNYLNGVVNPDGKTKVDGVWDRVSKHFVSQIKGEVHVLLSPQKEFGVFELSELEVLLGNPNVTKIEGVDRQVLVELAEKKGVAEVKHALSGSSFARIEVSGLLEGNAAKYLDTGANDVLTYIQDPAKLSALQQKMGSLRVSGFDNAVRGIRQLRGFIALAEAGAIAANRGVASHANKFGVAGVALSAMFAASEAEGASPEEARAIMEEWAIDAMGSEVGSIVAASLATAAAAAFTTLTAPVTIPLVIGASIAGGFLGSELAADLHAFVRDKDDAAERDILRRLSKLYFGEDTRVTAETIPAQGANFALIDPLLSPSAMAQAAKDSIVWRYAVVKLNPFLVPGGPYETLHNANGEFNRYDPVTGTGLTDEYLDARAEALSTRVRLLDQGEKISTGNVYPGGYDVHYLDAGEHGDSPADGAVLDLHYTSNFKGQRLFGADGSDVLTGSTQNDMLFGGAGNDRLLGKGGGDYLEGGKGHDTYAAGEGDRIFDHDGKGRVLFDGALLSGGTRVGTGGAFVSADRAHQFTLSGSDLEVKRLSDGVTLSIVNFEKGHLGIDLGQAAPPLTGNLFNNGTAASEVIYGQTNAAITDYELLNGYNLPDHIQGLAGRDWIYAWDNGPQSIQNGVVVDSAPDTDIVEGGTGKDFIHGGAGDDILYATEAADVAAVKVGQGSLSYGGPSDDEGDFVSGQSGDDELYGSGRVDGLFGGDGDDLIFGGGGDDVIAGDWSAVVSSLSLDLATYDYAWYSRDANGERQLHLFGYQGGLGKDHIFAGDGNDLVWGGASDDILNGGAGADQLNGDISGVDGNGNPWLPGQLHGSDFIAGGQGDDALNGNGGNDILLGEAGNDVLDGDFRILIGDDADYLGDDYLDGGPGNDTLSGNGGADLLLGGADDDALFGDLDGLDAAYHGADVLYGDAGVDQLVGQGGDDRLFGGSGDDQLYGDDLDLFVLSGDDSLFGGSGDDGLSGGLGNDVLVGGEGDDSLWGDAGDDRLSGGSGVDFLEGGQGADTYLFDAGDSPELGADLETLVDSAGQGNRIEFLAGVSTVSLDVVAAGNQGDLILRYTGSDALYVSGGLTGAIDSFSFGGGAPVSYRSLISTHLADSRYLDGGTGNDLVFGGAQDDLLTGGAGNDRLLGGGGNDLLDGGSGNNQLVGGPGADTYLIAANADSPLNRFAENVIIDSMDGSSTVRFGPGIEPTDVNLQFFGTTVLVSAGMQVVVLGNGSSGMLVNRFEFAAGDVLNLYELKKLFSKAPVSITGSEGDDVLLGTSGKDVINGGAGDDDLSGGAGRDKLDGGPGRDVMAGGTGFDTYVADSADDLVIENAGAGYDFVFASVDYVLPAHVEGLELTGLEPISGSGNELNNFIAGNSAANLLSGGAGDDLIQGKGGLDVIYGGAGDDELQGLFQVFGGTGNDRIVTSTYISNGSDTIYELSGGPGDDLYHITQPQHLYGLGSIIEKADEGEDSVVLRADVMLLTAGLPDNVENLRYEYSGEIWNGDGVVLFGNALNNRIEIGVPNPGSRPQLRGLGGDDVLIGSDLDESGSENAGLFGGDGNDQLYGKGGDDRLDGGAGDDLLDGGPGVDVLSGGIGLDTYVFSLGDSFSGDGVSVIDDPDGASVIRFGKGIDPDDIAFLVQDDDLHVSYSNNDAFVFLRGAGMDQIAGYAFASGSLYTQAEIDAHLKSNSAPVLAGTVADIGVYEGQALSLTLPAGVFEDPDGDVLQFSLVVSTGVALPTWLDFDEADRTLAIAPLDGDAGVYQLQFLAADADGATASADFTLNVADAFFISGGGTDDLLKGGAGADNLSAGAGDDRLYGYAGDDWLLAGDGADVLYGGQGNDTLVGASGDDVLNGQAGDDEMRGGEGNDRYFVDSIGDILVETAAAGTDRVYSSLEHRLGANFEELVLQGDISLDGFGNTEDNRLYGNVAANRLYGEDGDDRLYGRDGNDVLFGGAGNDVLNGQMGDDEMRGGAGDDRYFLDALGDMVVEAADAGFDRVYSQVDHVLADNLEDLILQGVWDINGSGNVGDNRLYGNTGNNELSGGAGNDRLYGRDGDDRLLGGAGNDILNGQAGADELIGGAGDDRYYLDSSADRLIEFGGEGHDRVYSYVDHAMGSNLEDLTLLGDLALSGTGNDSGNRLYGNTGDNELLGQGGDDSLFGRAGADRLSGGQGNDRVFGGDGDDLISGGAGDDLLDGGTGNDTYRFARGDGSDRIRAAGGSADSGGSDSIVFGPGISPDQVWFSRAGNDLLAQLVGVDDQIKVSGWYTSEQASVEQIACEEGGLIRADQVEQLIDAIAVFGVEQAPMIQLTADQQTGYSATIAAYWGTSQSA